MILIGVEFFTLFERKILCYSQCPKDFNKSGCLGLAQPSRDAIKMLSKELIIPNISNCILHYCSAFFLIIIFSLL